MEGFSVADAVTTAMGIFTSVIDVIIENPYLIAFLGAALIPLGFKIFKSAKSAAK